MLLLVLLLSACSSEPSAVLQQDHRFTASDDLPKRASYALIPEASTVLWNTQTLAGEERSGFVAMDQGVLVIDDSQVVSSTLVFDMQTFTVSRGPFDLHVYMNDYDYFDTYYYPDAKFSLRSLEPNGDGTYALTGMLEMVDITRQVYFDAQLYKKGKYFALEGTVEVDVIQWGIIQERSTSYQELGVEQIQDELYFDIEWVFEKQ
jgi:polyisoprenoid-binding protein YceI